MMSKWSMTFVISGVLTLFVRDVPSEQRIVGGNFESRTIPYQISLQGRVNSGIIDKLLQIMMENSVSEWTHFCGGSIITENHVLTAAHCLDGADHTKISVLVGSLYRTKGGHRHLIEKYTNHENYTKLHTNDISIIKVTKPFELGPAVEPINFRNTSIVGGGTKVRLTGWGYATPLATLPLPITLRTINLQTITNDQCRRYGFNVTSAEICTSSGLLRGACMGDSGGPLVNMDRSRIIGLVSYGSSICGAGRPEVYTRISQFVPWIEEQIKP